MALADAQSLAIRKLLSKAVFDSTVTPGPPLPKSHPSPALVAKLHLECSSLYGSALSLIRPSSSATSGKFRTTDGGEVTAELRRYLSGEVLFHDALARKWLGIDLGENGGVKKSGDAVGFLTWAKKLLEELKDGGKKIALGTEKERDAKDRRKEKVEEELQSVRVFLNHHKKINDTVSECHCELASQLIYWPFSSPSNTYLQQPTFNR